MPSAPNSKWKVGSPLNATRFSSSLPFRIPTFELQNSATPEILAAHSKALLQLSFCVRALLPEVGLRIFCQLRNPNCDRPADTITQNHGKIFKPPTVTMASAAAAGERTCYNCKSGSTFVFFHVSAARSALAPRPAAPEVPT